MDETKHRILENFENEFGYELTTRERRFADDLISAIVDELFDVAQLGE